MQRGHVVWQGVELNSPFHDDTNTINSLRLLCLASQERDDQLSNNINTWMGSPGLRGGREGGNHGGWGKGERGRERERGEERERGWGREGAREGGEEGERGMERVGVEERDRQRERCRDRFAETERERRKQKESLKLNRKKKREKVSVDSPACETRAGRRHVSPAPTAAKINGCLEQHSTSTVQFRPTHIHSAGKISRIPEICLAPCLFMFSSLCLPAFVSASPISVSVFVCLFLSVCLIDRQTDTHTHTDRHTDRHTDTYTPTHKPPPPLHVHTHAHTHSLTHSQTHTRPYTHRHERAKTCIHQYQTRDFLLREREREKGGGGGGRERERPNNFIAGSLSSVGRRRSTMTLKYNILT